MTEIRHLQNCSELVAAFRNLELVHEDGIQKVTALGRLIWHPHHEPTIVGNPFRFEMPLSASQLGELDWYLERYFIWTVGLAKQRAERLEAKLPEWGQLLYEAISDRDSTGQSFCDRHRIPDACVLTIQVDHDDEHLDQANAAAALFALPWELLNHGGIYLVHAQPPKRLRRSLCLGEREALSPTTPPIRILLISPRPESSSVPYIDHRVSALPMVEASEHLGNLIEISTLFPPTIDQLSKTLSEADEKGEPFHILHFDGHGVYAAEEGQGFLFFEQPQTDPEQIPPEKKVEAAWFAGVLAKYRLPLVILDACQSASGMTNVSGSVAGSLVQHGVASVVAMSHSILVSAAAIFMTGFYQALGRGLSISAAVNAGQQQMKLQPERLKSMGFEYLGLHDWFVPVLFQASEDPVLFQKAQELPEVGYSTPSNAHEHLAPAHGFHGRGRELLQLERTLIKKSYIAIIGQGGQGKTALACELATWLVRLGRFRKMLFVALDQYGDARTVLDCLGKQCNPQYTVALYGQDHDAAITPILQAIRDQTTIFVFDNVESVLALPHETAATTKEGSIEILAIAQRLLGVHETNRLLLTSREPLPNPFHKNYLELGRLTKKDGILLIGGVLAQQELADKSFQLNHTAAEIELLVDGLNGHARALVLLAPLLTLRSAADILADLPTILAEQDVHAQGNRERSLYAAIALSLKRLPPNYQKAFQVLAVFHQGFSLGILEFILEVDESTIQSLAAALIEVGLAEDMGYGYLQIDPALPSYLSRSLDKDLLEKITDRWADATDQLVSLLYQQESLDDLYIAGLSKLEVGNFLALLEKVVLREQPEQSLDLARKLEFLWAPLNLPRALNRVIQVRRSQENGLKEWTRLRFSTMVSEVDRLFESGRYSEALDAVRNLLARSEQAGEQAYPSARFDHLSATIRLGRILRQTGKPEDALEPLRRAFETSEALVKAGVKDSQRLRLVAAIDFADCLREMGQLEKAVRAYTFSIAYAEEHHHQAYLASSTGNLGIALMEQGRHQEAFNAYEKALKLFQELGAQREVASLWHQIGMLHENCERYEQAETGYLRSLDLESRLGNTTGEARSLNHLGRVYDSMKQYDQAVIYYQRAIQVYGQDNHLVGQGRAYQNLAVTQIKQQDLTGARTSLKQAIQCNEKLGWAARPWLNFHSLYALEKAIGNNDKAEEAKARARDLFLAYRRQGGENHEAGSRLCEMVRQSFKSGDAAQLLKRWEEYDLTDSQPEAIARLEILKCICAGDRNPGLVHDPNLHFSDSVEIQLLLEFLQ